MEPIQLKYAADLARFPGCPPDTAVGCQRLAFRYVHSDISDSRNFLPASKLNPQRQLLGKTRCIGMALSFWTTKEQALAAYNSYREKFQNFEKTAGDHVASGDITFNDGIACPVREDGHFSFFESCSANFGHLRFTIVQKLT